MIKKAFYAYSSQREDLLEDINSAVKRINDSGLISLTTWQDFPIGGERIIDNILEAIKDCDLFICDLTYLNSNVLYELGFAIANEKKIWITLNKSYPQAEANYKSFKAMTSIGYSSYENANDLYNNFFNDLPHEKETSFELDRSINAKHLIHLKCNHNTTSANLASAVLQKSNLPLKLDDAFEGELPLSWYLKELPNAVGVLIHFHTNESELEKPTQSGRKALVAGLAHGMGINTLLLAHDPYQPALDYHDVVKIHSNASHCETFVRDWLDPIIEKSRNREEEYREYKSDQKALGKLSNLIIGDFVAENENQDLIDYFIETAEYKEALKSQQVLFVGRKGTGKTANLIKLENELSSDKRNFVVTIQPQGHEFNGVANILSKMVTNSEKGHLIESIWKYLIYTEIANQYYDYLAEQPLHFERSEDDNYFVEFFERNQRFINADFTLRLSNIVGDLGKLEQGDSLEAQRFKVSEYLHSKMISALRDLIGKVLNRKEKVTILIDNLDKTWNDNEDLARLSDLLFGLLNVTQKITEEFQRKSYKHVHVNLSLIVFLRSDIFSRIMTFAPERDKLPYKHLSWAEPRQLFRVIENRIEYSGKGVTNPDQLWDNYFCKDVNGVPLKSYVGKLIIPRPRDIVFLFKTALQEAVNNGHVKVEEEDFLVAEYAYSDYALKSILPENGGRIKDLELILYEFAGDKTVVTYEEIDTYLCDHETETPELIKILCELTFLGQEVRENTFEYYSERRAPKITDKLADKFAMRKSDSRRYEINPAFRAYLDIGK